MLRVPVRHGGAGEPATAAVTQRGAGLRLRRWALAAVLLSLAAGAFLGYQRLVAAPGPAAASQTAAVQRGTITSTVSSTGTVAPLTQARLAFGVAGTVAEVAVKVGDGVAKGQDLARLDTTSLALQVSQARAQLASAEASLAKLRAGSKPQDIQAAQLALDAANVRLELIQAGGRPEEVAAAQAGLASAWASLSKLRAAPTEADVRAAEQSVAAGQAALQKAQGDLAALQAGATAEEVRAAELAVDQARNGLWSAQLSRDGTCGNTRSSQYQCDAANAQVAAAESGVAAALNNLAKVQAPPTAADLATAVQSVASAEAQLAAARAKLEQVRAGATAAELAAAQAAVTQAEQTLALKQQPYTEADLQAQRQAVAQAAATLAAKQAPYSEADLLVAQASVEQARAQLALAEHNLARATLTAPFDGVVSAVGVSVGETAASPAVTLVDPRAVRLDVTVDEADIARIRPGQRASITFDSIAGTTFAGQVTGVAPSATLTSGVATYLVAIGIADPGPVRPGMTGNASIVYGEASSVLVVPNRAVRTQGRSRVVEVLAADGQRETRQVKVGVSNDQLTEIAEGLAEGEQVVISATTAAQPRSGAPLTMGAPAGGPVIVGGPAGGPPPPPPH